MDTDADALPEELHYHREMAKALRQRLWQRDLQRAQMGINTPPEIRTEIDALSHEMHDHEVAITRLQAQVEQSANQGLPPLLNTEGFTTKTFATAEDILEYNAQRMAEANHSIDALTWGTDEPNFTPAEDAAYDTALAAMHQVCLRGVLYREVMAFHDQQYVDRAESLLMMNLPSYNLKFYDFDAHTVPPLMHFIIFDSAEVTFAFYRWPVLSPQKEVRLATKQPDVVRLFVDYYEAIWQGAKPLKIGNRIEMATFQEIKRRWYPNG